MAQRVSTLTGMEISRAGAVLTIGHLAQVAGVHPKTIRYYEEVGLLPRPRRSEAGYRLYSSHDVSRLQLIKRAKLLSLSLTEIKDIVAYAVDGRCTGLHRHLLSLLTAKLSEVEHRMEEMLALRQEMQRHHHELSERLAQMEEEEVCPSPEPCSCVLKGFESAPVPGVESTTTERR